MPVYADTSFLMALYGADEFTAAAKRQVGMLRDPILLCDLNRLEFENALRLLRFRKLVSPRFAMDASAALAQDEQAGLLRAMAVDWPAVFVRAREISARRTVKGGHRAMDILHVATALEHEAGRFYSFDQRQRALARQEGLRLNEVGG